MEPTTKASFCTITAAVAHDLNNELTVILTSVTRSIEALEPDDPMRDLLQQLQSAAQRCAWKASTLLNFSLRQGAKPVAAPSEQVIEWIEKSMTAGSGKDGQ